MSSVSLGPHPSYPSRRPQAPMRHPPPTPCQAPGVLVSSTQKEHFHSGVHLLLCSPTLLPSAPTCWHVVKLALGVESQGSRCLQGALPHRTAAPAGQDTPARPARPGPRDWEKALPTPLLAE